MGDLKPEAVKKILRRLNTLFQVAPIELWAPKLDASGAFVKIMTPMSGNVRPPLQILPPHTDDDRIVGLRTDSVPVLVYYLSYRTCEPRHLPSTDTSYRRSYWSLIRRPPHYPPQPMDRASEFPSLHSAI